MTISTAGIVPEIYRFASEDSQVNLAVSLNAPDDNLRRKLMPVARYYPLDRLLTACRHYVETTRRRLSFEYVLLKDTNDRPEHARQLAAKVKHRLFHVNLIRFNPMYKRYDFHKKNFLWNMDRVYPEAFHGDLDHVFVVEGYKACLWLIQHGAWNTVALMGTYLSSMQQRLLSRLGATIVFLLDNTELAEKGAYEAGKWLAASNTVRVCNYPEEAREGAQPDDLGADDLIETLETAENFLSWRIRYESTLRSKPRLGGRIREQN